MQNKNFTFNSSKAREFFLEKISFEKSPRDLEKDIKTQIENINIVDVRDYDDYIDGHIPFAIHIPLNDIEEHIKMFDKDKLNIVYSYCPNCTRSEHAAYIIAENSHPVMILRGGYYIWHKMGFDTVKTSANE